MTQKWRELILLGYQHVQCIVIYVNNTKLNPFQIGILLIQIYTSVFIPIYAYFDIFFDFFYDLLVIQKRVFSLHMFEFLIIFFL